MRIYREADERRGSREVRLLAENEVPRQLGKPRDLIWEGVTCDRTEPRTPRIDMKK
jgi:hypothetical protein